MWCLVVTVSEVQEDVCSHTLTRCTSYCDLPIARFSNNVQYFYVTNSCHLFIRTFVVVLAKWELLHLEIVSSNTFNQPSN